MWNGMDQQVGGEAARLDDGGHGKGGGDDVLLRHLHAKPSQLCMQGASGSLRLVCYQLHLVVGEKRISMTQN